MYFRDDQFLKLLGEKLREARKAKGLTQAEVAYELDLPVSQIGRMERGEANFGVSYLNALGRVLDKKPNEFLEF